MIIEIKLTTPALQMVEELTRLGLYGNGIIDVVERMVEERLRQLVAEKIIQPRSRN